MHAEKCPICKGTGEVISHDVMITDGRYTHISPYPFPINKKCHGCNGKGWVEVSDDINYLYPRNDWRNVVTLVL